MMRQTVMIRAKSMMTSKTFWLNALMLIIGVIAVLNEIIVATTDLVTIPADVTRWLLIINTSANIVLRRVTDTPARFLHGGDVVSVDQPNPGP